jgi:hypothetical protein
MSGISIWDIDMGYRISMRYRYGYRYGIWEIDMGYGISMVIHHIDIVILDIDVGYGLMIWEMTVTILPSRISI